MTPEEAVRGYTTWAARAMRLEQRTGSLEPGKWADLTILDIDPLVVGTDDPAQLLDGSVLITVVAGEIVYQAP